MPRYQEYSKHATSIENRTLLRIDISPSPTKAGSVGPPFIAKFTFISRQCSPDGFIQEKK